MRVAAGSRRWRYLGCMQDPAKVAVHSVSSTVFAAVDVVSHTAEYATKRCGSAAGAAVSVVGGAVSGAAEVAAGAVGGAAQDIAKASSVVLSPDLVISVSSIVILPRVLAFTSQTVRAPAPGARCRPPSPPLISLCSPVALRP